MLSRSARERSAPSPATVDTVTAADGHAVPIHVFEPPPGVRLRATALVAGGTAIRQSFYARFAEYLARGGVRAITYDYRGIGEARPPSLRGFAASMSDWARLDTRAVLRFARGGHEPLVLVGHSFGGQQIGLLDELGDVDGAVLVGVQLGTTAHWPLLARARNSLLFRSAPLLTSLFGYMPGSLGLGGVDLPAGAANEWARWCLHPDYLMGFDDDARARFARFQRPALYYSFTDDDYAPRKAVDAFLRAASGAKLVHRRLAPANIGLKEIGHFGYFRPAKSASEPTLWKETLEFVEDVAAGRPPRARPWSADNLFEITDEEILEDLAR